ANMTGSRLRSCLRILLLLPLGALTSAASASPDEAPPPPAAFSTEDCKACHEKAVTAVEKTHHAGVAQSCAACHGDVTEHLKSNLEKGEPGPIKSMKQAKAAEVNQTCQGCHEKSHNATWAG